MAFSSCIITKKLFFTRFSTLPRFAFLNSIPWLGVSRSQNLTRYLKILIVGRQMWCADMKLIWQSLHLKSFWGKQLAWKTMSFPATNRNFSPQLVLTLLFQHILPHPRPSPIEVHCSAPRVHQKSFLFFISHFCSSVSWLSHLWESIQWLGLVQELVLVSENIMVEDKHGHMKLLLVTNIFTWTALEGEQLKSRTAERIGLASLCELLSPHHLRFNHWTWKDISRSPDISRLQIWTNSRIVDLIGFLN